MPKKPRKPRAPSIKQKLVKELRSKLKELNHKIKQHKRDLASLVGRKRKREIFHGDDPSNIRVRIGI